MEQPRTGRPVLPDGVGTKGRAVSDKSRASQNRNLAIGKQQSGVPSLIVIKLRMGDLLPTV